MEANPSNAYNEGRSRRDRSKIVGVLKLLEPVQKRRRPKVGVEEASAPVQKRRKRAALLPPGAEHPLGRKTVAAAAGGGGAGVGGGGKMMHWIGEPTVDKRGCEHFGSYMTAGGPISLYDYVYIAQEEEQGLGRYMGYVEDLYETPEKSRYVLVKWFYLPRELNMKVKDLWYGAKEIFYTPQVQLLSVECVDGVCTVLSPREYEVALRPAKRDEHVYVCGRMYDMRRNTFQRFDVSSMEGYSKQPWLRRLMSAWVKAQVTGAQGAAAEGSGSESSDTESDTESEDGAEEEVEISGSEDEGEEVAGGAFESSGQGSGVEEDAQPGAPPSASEEPSVEATRTPSAAASPEASPASAPAPGVGAGTGPGVGPGFQGFPLECDRACCAAASARVKRWCRLGQGDGACGCGHAAHPRRNWCYPRKAGYVPVYRAAPPPRIAAAAATAAATAAACRVAAGASRALSSTSSPARPHSPHAGREDELAGGGERSSLTHDLSDDEPRAGGEGEAGEMRLSARVKARGRGPGGGEGAPFRRASYDRWEKEVGPQEAGRGAGPRVGPPGKMNPACNICSGPLRRLPVLCSTPGCWQRAHKKCVGMRDDGTVLPFKCGQCVRGGVTAVAAVAPREEQGGAPRSDGPASSADGPLTAEAEDEPDISDDEEAAAPAPPQPPTAAENAFAALEAELATVQSPVVMRNGIRMRLPAKSSTKFGLLCVLCKDPLKRDPARCVGPGCRDRAHKKCVRAAAAYKRGQIDPAGNDCFSKFLCPCCDGGDPEPARRAHPDPRPAADPAWNGGAIDVETLDKEQMEALDMDMAECDDLANPPGQFLGELSLGLLEENEADEPLQPGSIAHMWNCIGDDTEVASAAAAAAAAAGARAGGEAGGGEDDEPEASDVTQASTVSSDGRSQEMLMEEEGDDADSGARGGNEGRAAAATADSGKPAVGAGPEEAAARGEGASGMEVDAPAAEEAAGARPEDPSAMAAKPSAPSAAPAAAAAAATEEATAAGAQAGGAAADAGTSAARSNAPGAPAAAPATSGSGAGPSGAKEAPGPKAPPGKAATGPSRGLPKWPGAAGGGDSSSSSSDSSSDEEGEITAGPSPRAAAVAAATAAAAAAAAAAAGGGIAAPSDSEEGEVRAGGAHPVYDTARDEKGIEIPMAGSQPVYDADAWAALRQS